jgi:lipopolysaccharide export system protein LptC
VMSAATMVHFPDDDTTELVGPRLLHAKPQQDRFSVRAERGQLSRDGDEIFLYGDVLLVREATAGRPEARMTTEFLHVLRDRSLARTDRHVKIVEGNRTLSGRGMEYNNLSRELVLRSEVQARFDTLEAE